MQTPGDNTSVPVVINTSSWPRTEVIDINSDHLSAIVQKNDILTQQELNGGTLGEIQIWSQLIVMNFTILFSYSNERM